MSPDDAPTTPNPEIKEEYGIDPATILNRSLESHDNALPLAVIRGIRNPEILDLFYEIEGILHGDPDADGFAAIGRRRIILALNRRREELRERDPPAKIDRGESSIPSPVFVDEEGNERSRKSASSKIAKLRSDS